jgi:hypothetical protein
MLPAGAEVPVEGPCKAMDFELEMVRGATEAGTAALFGTGQAAMFMHGLSLASLLGTGGGGLRSRHACAAWLAHCLPSLLLTVLCACMCAGLRRRV